MVILIILCIIFCPGILFIWMCWCNASTAKNTRIIKETLLQQIKDPDYYETLGEYRDRQEKAKKENITGFCIVGILIIACLLLLIILSA